MIDLRTEPHTPLNHEEKGVMLKHWLELDGERYLFKTNYKYPDYTTYSNFGEVLYTNLSKKLNFPCVESYFATTNYYEDNCNGVLIKTFIKDYEKEDTMSYSDMIYMARTRDLNFYYKSNFDNVESCMEVVRYVAKYLDKKVDFKQIHRDLVKMAIVDCFLGQSDRHQTNIEFIFDREHNMRLAPTFDNGLCLSFGYTDFQVEEFLARDEFSKFRIQQDVDSSDVRFMGNNNMFVISRPKMFRQNMDDAFIVDILKEASKDSELRDLVENLLTLDIDKSLEILDMQNEVKLPKNYKELASRIYKNRRHEFCKVVEKNKRKFAKLKLTLDIDDEQGEPLEVSQQKLQEDLAKEITILPPSTQSNKLVQQISRKDTDDGMLQ